MRVVNCKNSTPEVRKQFFALVVATCAIVDVENSDSADVILRENGNELIVGTEEEATDALRNIVNERDTEFSREESQKFLSAHVNPFEANDLGTSIEIDKVDFAGRPHITWQERIELVKWFRENDGLIFDISGNGRFDDPRNHDVSSVDLLQLGQLTWELIPERATYIQYPSLEQLKRRLLFQELSRSPNSINLGEIEGKLNSAGQSQTEDVRFVGEIPKNENGETHPLEKISERVIRGKFNPMKVRQSSDHVYPEFTDLYTNRLDPEISVYLITNPQWQKLLDTIIHPKRKADPALDSASTPEGSEEELVEFYPVKIPHDFNLWSEPLPTDTEEHYGVLLKKYLTHPYDWHIFRANLVELTHEEVDRIVHISQGMYRNHKQRQKVADNLWSRYTVRLTAFDPKEAVSRNLLEERTSLAFYHGRRHATDFFHRHHKKARADLITKSFINEALKQYDPADIARVKKFNEYMATERVSEQYNLQQERKRMADEYRAGVRWWMVPWYMVKGMMGR